MKPKFDIKNGKIYKFTLIDKSKPKTKQRKDLYFFGPDYAPVSLEFFKSSFVLDDTLQDPTLFLKSSYLTLITIDDIVSDSIEIIKKTEADKLIEQGVFELKNKLWE
ncbi:MAG: hypothetical protein ACYDDE_03900 [bacterium]